MDPRLVRLCEQGGADDEVAAILRLNGGPPPPGVRVVSRFGDIATVRVRRGDIPAIHAAASVASMKPAGPLLREARVTPAVPSPLTALPGDDRRPHDWPDCTGRGVVVGIVDWGFDFAHPDFRSPDGTTRLLALWDQSAPEPDAAPAPFGYGTLFLPDRINAALASPNPYAALGYRPADSDSDGGGTHGTHVAGIAAGNGRAGGPTGVAPAAALVFVHLTTLGGGDADLADSATVLEAIDFIRRVAGSRPWVVNLSMGQCGDQHDGTTLVEQGFDAALSEAPGRAIVQSTGNYFDSRLHSSGRLRAGQPQSLTWRVAAGGSGTDELEIWYAGADTVAVAVQAPDGGPAGRAPPGTRVMLSWRGRRCGMLHHRLHEPNNFDNHVVLWLHPEAPRGEWRLTIEPQTIVDGRYHAWIQRNADGEPAQADFTPADANRFFTTGSICNGRHTIAVGAYDGHKAWGPIATFSSAGPTRDGRSKPELVAPGIDVLSARSAPDDASAGTGMQVRMSGTSMAAPHVTGTVALMFEAAGRPLAIGETRALLHEAARRSADTGHDHIRYGSGYLDTDRAVAAAQRPAPAFAETINGGIAMAPSDPPASDAGQNLPGGDAGQNNVPPDKPMPGNFAPGDAGQSSAANGAANGSGANGGGANGSAANGGSANGSGDTVSGAGDTANGATAPVAKADALVGCGGAFAGSPQALLAGALSGCVDPRWLGPAAANGLLDPATLFDIFTTARLARYRPALDPLFMVVAYPRQWLGDLPQPGDVLVRRALGEPGVGHLGFLAEGGLYPGDEARRRGLRLEGRRPGFYAPVIEAGAAPHRRAHGFARRVTAPTGHVPVDTLILRPRLAGAAGFPTEQVVPPAPPQPPVPAPGPVQVPAVHPAPAPPARIGPPPQVANQPLGIDANSAVPGLNNAAFANLKARGRAFVILKSSQGTQAYHRWFSSAYQQAHDNGLIRGAYHFLANKHGTNAAHFPWRAGSIADQANLVITEVPPLLPGDLAPFLDLEDEPVDPQTDHPPVATAPAQARARFPLDQGLFAGETGYHYRAAGHNVHGHFVPIYADHGAAGRHDLLTDIQDFFDRIETALGRTPSVYTANMWTDSDMMNNPADLDANYPISHYPLWAVYHSHRTGDPNAVTIGNWGQNWSFVQYGEEGHDYWFGNDLYRNYHETGIAYGGVDYDAFKGSLYELRGLADIGRVGVAYLGAVPYIAHADSDDHLHALNAQAGTAQDLAASVGGSSGDPVLIAGPATLYAYLRSGSHLVEMTAAADVNWRMATIEDTVNGSPVRPLQDPRAVLVDGRCYVVYVGDDYDWHLLIATGHGWRRTGGMLAQAGLRPAANTGIATGQPAVYVTGGVPHVVGRVDRDGHLVDIGYDGTRWTHDDVTALARATVALMPAATYSPCVYETTAAGVVIVFRALRGDLWIIARNSNAPTNLMTAAQPAGTRPMATAGHPTCFVVQDKPHIVYRGADGMVYEIWLDAGTWHSGSVCSAAADKAAADPVATTGSGGALVAFRGADGRIHTARFDGTAWTCAAAAG